TPVSRGSAMKPTKGMVSVADLCATRGFSTATITSGVAAHRLSRHIAKTLEMPAGGEGLDDQILAFDVAVTGVLYNAAPVLADLRFNELPEMGFEAFVRPLLILSHKSRITCHIGGEDSGETAGCSHCSGKPARLRPTNTVLSRSVVYWG